MHGTIARLVVSVYGSTYLGLPEPSRGALWVESDFAKLLERRWLVNFPTCEIDAANMKHNQFTRVVQEANLEFHWRQPRVGSNPTADKCVLRFTFAFCVIKDEGR